MKLPTWTKVNRDEVVYALEYPNGGHHSIKDEDEPESMFGILCCRERICIETWLRGLNIENLALECKVVEITLGELIDKPREESYTIWIMDKGFDDREIIYF